MLSLSRYFVMFKLLLVNTVKLYVHICWVIGVDGKVKNSVSLLHVTMSG